MRSRVFGSLICLSGLLLASLAFSQTVITAGTQIATSSNTQIAFNNNITISSNDADFSKATFTLTGTDQNLTSERTGSSVVLGGLIIGVNGGTGNGTKNISGGSWEIAGSLVFEDGIIVPQTSSNGKIIHTVGTGSAGDVLVNNPLSYVNGTFYSMGSGTRTFPIGNNSGYFPALLTSVDQGDLEIGMQVVNQDAGFTFGSEILDVFTGQLWELFDPSESLKGSFVSLSSLGADAADFIEPTIGTVIVASTARGSEGISLGGSASGDLIVGEKPIKTGDKIFTLGKIGSDQVKVKIHNVITPSPDNANDYLQIENIEIFPENSVKLLDRWGVLVKEWTNFANVGVNPDPSYDLSDIATGNYICIVEYKDGSSTKSLSQMITIINR